MTDNITKHTNVTKHCKTCGSDNLKFEADAIWDVATQSYTFVGPDPQSDVYCVECGDAVEVEEKPVPALYVTRCAIMCEDPPKCYTKDSCLRADRLRLDP